MGLRAGLVVSGFADAIVRSERGIFQDALDITDPAARAAFVESACAGDLTLLETQLAAQPFEDLEIISRRFPGRNHYNVVADAYVAGLSALFAPSAA